ncbi:hypothetical protein [Paenibacillus aestuarii]|uniref:LysM domain-containing protein n=1 Tax=Paenibacillus aestuarii TaxID=516965 RepID=A0ABW0KBH7_9BACL|nr:hypothetical protein [Paenibacillus aestuarii]
MKTIGKKILTGSLIASFVLGVGVVGALHNNAFAATASQPTTSTTQKSDKAGWGMNGQDHRGGRQGGFFGGNVIKETATILNTDEATISASLKEGKTLVEIATASGLTEADYLQKLVAAETASINEQVTAGKLTQDQADKIISGLSDQLTKQIENKGVGGKGGFPGGDGQRGGGFGGIRLTEQAASVLAVEQSAVDEALHAGKTLAAFAQEKGVSEADFVQKLVAAETTAINAEVTAGKLTQDQADKMLSGLSGRLTKQVENTGPIGRGGHGGPAGPGGLGIGNPDTLTTILGVTVDEMRTQLDAGKSIVDIAASKGISEEDLISKIKDSMTDSIKKFVEDKHTRPDGEAPAAPTTTAPAAN